MTDLPPDDKDWTWVIDAQCPDCGFTGSQLHPADNPGELQELLRRNAFEFVDGLTHESARSRAREDRWSVLEYCCHVRDVHRIFYDRVALMLAKDNPAFENWDQDATAREDNYAGQEPATVASDLIEAAAKVSALYSQVSGDEWQRGGLRSNGSVFTVDSICRYHLHDVVHHAWDIRQLTGDTAETEQVSAPASD